MHALRDRKTGIMIRHNADWSGNVFIYYGPEATRFALMVDGPSLLAGNPRLTCEAPYSYEGRTPYPGYDSQEANVALMRAIALANYSRYTRDAVKFFEQMRMP